MGTSSNIRHKVNHGLDVTKLFCAFLILFMHAYFNDLGQISTWFRHVITTIGVPFFFITSGYFFMIGLLRNNHSRTYLKKYVWRVAKMYFIWSAITLPVSWLCIEWGHPDYSIPLKIVYLFRMFFFSGSCGIYWYLLALVVCSLLIYYFSFKESIGLLYIIATILFFVGVVYDSHHYDDFIIFKLIHAVFGSERNFLNVGLFYMCIGAFYASHHIKCNNTVLIIALIFSVIARTIEFHFSCFQLMQVAIATALFLWARNINIDIDDEKSITMRKFSTAIYLLHFPFLLVVDYNFKRGTLTGFFSALVFSATTYYILKRVLPEKGMKLLFG